MIRSCLPVAGQTIEGETPGEFIGNAVCGSTCHLHGEHIPLLHLATAFTHFEFDGSVVRDIERKRSHTRG